MAILFQLLSIAMLLGYIVLILAALWFLRRQSLTERELLLWDALVLFTPIGAFIVFLYFPRASQQR